jgi:hypothetical protein
MGAHDIFSVVLGLVIAGFCSVHAILSLRSGECGARIVPIEIRAVRATRPWLYWMFLTLLGSCAAMGLSLALIFVPSYSIGVSAAVAFALFLGLVLIILATICGVYATYGFRSGKAVVVAKGVSIHDRSLAPVGYWIAQIINVVVTLFFGAMGLGAWIFVGWNFLWPN